jgi:hypothetical protein
MRRVEGCGRSEENGQVLAITAFSLITLLVFGAFVIDVGRWYVHHRQLQTRADAGALAAGVEYERSWAACVGGDAAAAARIENYGRAFAGDPGAVLPAFNTEVADQAKVSVQINSTSFDSASSDGGGPCFDHPPDADSPAGGYWTDVKVKERDLPSLFGSLGLPLSRNVALARVEVHPELSESGFVPLAVPERQIMKAQLRYYNYCSSPPTLLAKTYLSLLKDRDPMNPVALPGYQTVAGTSLWGPSRDGSENDPFATVDPTSIPLTLPPKAGCGQEYIPIGAEVRVAGRTGIDIDSNDPTACATLAAGRFTGCWSRLSEIRAWKTRDATPPAGPQFGNVVLSGGTCAADPYFARTPSCASTIGVDVDWGDLDGLSPGQPDPLNVAANFSVTIEGQALDPPTNGNASGTWTLTRPILTNAASGANPIDLTYSWTDNDPTHVWRTNQCKKTGSPCKLSGSSVVHRTFVGNDANAGTVDLIRNAAVVQAQGQQLPSPLDNTQAPDAVATSISVFPTVGLRSSLRARQRRVLRASDAQGNQSLDCEPSGGQGHDFQMFYKGCQPSYGRNTFTQGIWWDVPTQRCPGQNTIFSQPNSADQFWQCVPAAPGFSPGVIADGIAARTGNCTDSNLNDPNKNSCANTACIHPNQYVQWLAGTSTDKSRIVDVFVVPYGAFKGVNAGDGVPISDFAKFYVTGWGGNGASGDPCSGDDPAQPGEIVGYFVEFVGANTNPVDLDATCVLGQLTPCRALLVR